MKRRGCCDSPPFNFDASIEEVFATLSAGATLVLRTDALLESMLAFAAGVEQMGITHLDLPTAFWNEWVVALTAGQAHIPAGLTTVIIGGEAVYPEQLAQWQRQGRSDVRLFNTYGPTETTVVVTTQELQQEDPSQAQLPIGLPLPGMQALILGAGERTRQRGGSWCCSARSWPTATWGACKAALAPADRRGGSARLSHWRSGAAGGRPAGLPRSARQRVRE